MAESTNDDEITCVIVKSKCSIFTWYFVKYKNTISQSETCPQELEIQAGFIKFSGFSRECDQNQDIPYLPLPLNPYAQERIQEQSI